VQVEPASNNVFAKRSSGELVLLASRYGLWATAAVSAGLVSGSLFPTEVPVAVIVAALIGLGIWLADVNRRHRCGQGVIADTLLGVFISAVMFKWSYIVAVTASGHFEELSGALSQLTELN
jgi:hypothetical protein